jgi:predicted enzyme related to lactoylglutathione lyase
MKQSPVVHFEMPAKDNARVAKFYTEAFGWQMNQLGPEMGNYLLAGTTPVDENKMALNPGAINGGFFEWKDEDGMNSPHIVIQVDNLDESIEAVKKSGGTITSGKMPIPGIGTYVSIKDTEGNHIGMLQP